jgi:hypothetical protein
MKMEFLWYVRELDTLNIDMVNLNSDGITCLFHQFQFTTKL